MSPRFVETKKEYIKDEHLKEEDVENLMTWAQKQPHLPKITELQTILFLQSCYYRNEAAKGAIDAFFTTKTLCPYLYREENPSLPELKKAFHHTLVTVLPEKTPQGDTIIFMRYMNPNPENFDFVHHVKYFDMVTMMHLYQDGTSEGHMMIVDMKESTFGHFTRTLTAGPTTLKHFLFYLQEAMPIRLKALHFVNIVPFMDRVMAMIKPFMKKELLDVIHLHISVDDLLKYVPLECLPEGYGGRAEPIDVLHEKVQKKLLENVDLFEWTDLQTVDESKRQKKFKNFDDVFGTEGTFKRLDID